MMRILSGRSRLDSHEAPALAAGFLPNQTLATSERAPTLSYPLPFPNARRPKRASRAFCQKSSPPHGAAPRRAGGRPSRRVPHRLEKVPFSRIPVKRPAQKKNFFFAYPKLQGAVAVTGQPRLLRNSVSFCSMEVLTPASSARMTRTSRESLSILSWLRSVNAW